MQITESTKVYSVVDAAMQTIERAIVCAIDYEIACAVARATLCTLVQYSIVGGVHSAISSSLFISKHGYNYTFLEARENDQVLLDRMIASSFLV